MSPIFQNSEQINIKANFLRQIRVRGEDLLLKTKVEYLIRRIFTLIQRKKCSKQHFSKENKRTFLEMRRFFYLLDLIFSTISLTKSEVNAPIAKMERN